MSPAILILEDSEDDRFHFESAISKLPQKFAHCHFDFVFDGTHAFNWLDQNPSPTLIITDHHMKPMDGAAFTKNLKNSVEYCDIPIAMITGYVDDPIAQSIRHHLVSLECKNKSADDLADWLSALLNTHVIN